MVSNSLSCDLILIKPCAVGRISINPISQMRKSQAQCVMMLGAWPRFSDLEVSVFPMIYVVLKTNCTSDLPMTLFLKYVWVQQPPSPWFSHGGRTGRGGGREVLWCQSSSRLWASGVGWSAKALHCAARGPAGKGSRGGTARHGRPLQGVGPQFTLFRPRNLGKPVS